MKYFADILKQFSTKQRMFVLLILLMFTSTTYLLTTYLKTNNKGCEELMELNKKYINDFILISEIIRQERMSDLGIKPDSTSKHGLNKISHYKVKQPTSNTNTLDSVLMIVDQNIK